MPQTEYPVQLTIDYPDRPLDRVSSAFRLIVAIPILIVLGAVSGGTGQSGGRGNANMVIAGMRWRKSDACWSFVTRCMTWSKAGGIRPGVVPSPSAARRMVVSSSASKAMLRPFGIVGSGREDSGCPRMGKRHPPRPPSRFVNFPGLC